MDKLNNPFCPGAGSPPPELAGRDAVLDQAKTLLGRVKKQKPERSLLLTGLRGVGKTVLLNEIERLACEEGFRTITLEAYDGKSLAALLAPNLRSLLFEFNRGANIGNKAKRALTVLKSFVNSISLKLGGLEIGIDLEPETGTADSGDLEIDLPELFIAVAEAAEERGRPVAIIIDEIQYLNITELSALIMAMHKMQQRVLPLVLVAAGLPILPALAGESKSYAERLFDFPLIGPLNKDDAGIALRDPVKTEGVEFCDDAIEEIYNLTQGYPYFLQEWGYQAWNLAETSPISLNVIKEANEVVLKRLDENFFRVRFERLTPREKVYLHAMADLGEGPYKTGEIAKRLNTSVSSLSTPRASLVRKGMIYSPEYGDMDFTVPLFGDFIKRAIPDSDGT